MTGHYEPDHAETDAERAEREHDERLDADARAQERGPGVAVCPNGHAMDDGLFNCPACGAYRPSKAGGSILPRDIAEWPEPDAVGRAMNDEMAALARDAERERRYKRLARELSDVYEEILPTRRMLVIRAAIDALNEECAAIVRRWD